MSGDTVVGGNLGPEDFDRTSTFLAGVRTATLLERPLDIPGLPNGLSTKILSRSADGSVSQVVSAAGGWSAGGGRSFSALTEMFVLDGVLHVGSEVLRHYSYLRVPAGTTVSGIEAGAEGCRFLMFSTGLLEMIPAAGEAALEPPVAARDELGRLDHTGGHTRPVTQAAGRGSGNGGPYLDHRPHSLGQGDQQMGDAPVC